MSTNNQMWSTEISVISMALTESNHFLINVSILLFCLRMNPFHTSVLSLYPLKMSENLCSILSSPDHF